MPRKLKKPLIEPDRKECPYYRYGEGWWRVNSNHVIPELGRAVRIGLQWYSTKDEAMAAYELKVREIIEADKDANETKWEDLREAFIQKRKKKNIALSSILTKDRAVLKTFFDPFYKGRPVKEIFTKKEALAFNRRLFELKNKYGDTYCQKDLNKAVNTYQSCLLLASQMDLIDYTSYYFCNITVEPVRIKNAPPTGRERPTFALTSEEERKLLEALPEGTMDGDLFRFLLWTGFRIGEALALTPNEIDFDNEKILKEWDWVKDDKGGMYRSHSTKNGCNGSYIVSRKVISMLELHIKAFSIEPSDYLFCGKSGKRPLDQSAFGKRIRSLCEKLGVRYCHPHILRHTFCTKLASLTNGSNLDIKVVEGLTGHTFDVNQNQYTHASETRMRELVNKA